jgi:hypothetical protein
VSGSERETPTRPRRWGRSLRSFTSAMSGNSMPWPGGSIVVHGYSKQGSGYGYSGVRGLNALLATVSTKDSAPVVVAQRLRKGSCGSPRGAARLVADGLRTTVTLAANSGRALVRADSAFYGHAVAGAARRASNRAGRLALPLLTEGHSISGVLRDPRRPRRVQIT